ncbi:MAG TPA: glycerol-3-phosphate dehydrogenase/oxidase [Candidatus Sulfotelmatobacter sp.]|nr:glycerol-3-phosphate dehydrogenase/oxidase [Candidatus Sulfotelmatobacter sp.]
MNRADGLARLAAERFDVLIVGGGATGLGAAVDAAARGYRTALIEADDFAKATSSRSTKLVHGGVRYLQQGDIGLVREALHERTALVRNAPHLVHDRAFVVPAYRWLELPYYGAGLAAYDVLAGWSNAFPLSRLVGPRGARTLIPGLRADGLHGAIVYHDGQFDDARLAVTLARTAVDRGAAVANYVRATGFVYAGTRIAGVRARDAERGDELTIRARVVVNAAGIFVDALRRLDVPDAPALLTHSRGSHIVVRASALGDANAALLVPKTPDGRVLFAVPWHEHVVVGTTDVPAPVAELDPQPTRAEIAYILETVNRYLAQPLDESDILSAWAGLRPLVNRGAARTAALSREHLIDVADSGLVTITGGKWTTYRKMAADVIDVAMRVGALAPAPPVTEHLPLHGALGPLPAQERLHVYGSDAPAVLALEAAAPAAAALLDPRLPYTQAEVTYAARAEMARTVDDVLARRTRALFLDAAAARAGAPRVASLLAAELGRDAGWERDQLAAFDALADRAEAPPAA